MADIKSDNIIIVRNPITLSEVREIADHWYKNMVKGVADVKRKVIALGGEWHMDANIVLIADGSLQEDVWGFNVYPDEKGDTAIEYISLINIRPAQWNRTMEIEDVALRASIKKIVGSLIPDLGL